MIYKIYFLLLLTILISSCSSTKEYSINEIKELESTHFIKDSLIVKQIDFLLKSGKMKVDNDEFISLKVERLPLLNSYSLTITKTLFSLEKHKFYYQNYDKMALGFLNFNNEVILLHGDIKFFFERKKNVKAKNIFYSKKINKPERISIIYDPIVFNYKIKEDQVFLLSWY